MLLPKSDRGLRCECGCHRSRVLWTRHKDNGIERGRQCNKCRARFTTEEKTKQFPGTVTHM